MTTAIMDTSSALPPTLGPSSPADGPGSDAPSFAEQLDGAINSAVDAPGPGLPVAPITPPVGGAKAVDPASSDPVATGAEPPALSAGPAVLIPGLVDPKLARPTAAPTLPGLPGPNDPPPDDDPAASPTGARATGGRARAPRSVPPALPGDPSAVLAQTLSPTVLPSVLPTVPLAVSSVPTGVATSTATSTAAPPSAVGSAPTGSAPTGSAPTTAPTTALPPVRTDRATIALPTAALDQPAATPDAVVSVAAGTAAAPTIEFSVTIADPVRPDRRVAAADSSVSAPPAVLADPVSADPVSAALVSAAPPAVVVTPTSTVAAPSASPAADVPEQISAVLIPLRGHDSGSHQLTVRLHPADLGPVSLTAHLDRGSISVELTSASDEARAAMTVALPALHRNLHDAGFGSVTVSMGTGGSGGAAPDLSGNAMAREQRGSSGQPESPAAGPSTSPVRSSSPDVRPQSADTALDRWL